MSKAARHTHRRGTTPPGARPGARASSSADGRSGATTRRGPASRPGPDEIAWALAEVQHGVVGRQQLLAAGVPPGWIDRRLRSGWLHIVHRGVYRVGPVTAPGAEQMAAALACGPHAAIGVHSAAERLRMLDPPRDRPPVTVLLTSGNRRVPGVRTRRMTLLPDEIVMCERVPTTSPARTILDLAGEVEPRQLERAIAAALAKKLTTRRALMEMRARHPTAPGARRLKELLVSTPGPTRSELEDKFLALVRRARIHEPEVNVTVCGFEVDFYWAPKRLVVEIDGFAWHRLRPRHEHDRRRDGLLLAAGINVLRLTWQQVTKEREATIALLVETLTVSGHRLGPTRGRAGADAIHSVVRK
jgi:very-short-patch-repair endonuclease